MADAEDARVELQECINDLKRAEKERAEALLYKTEVETLKNQLSAKEQEVRDLENELKERERELTRLRNKQDEASARGQSKPKIGRKSDILGFMVQSHF